MEKTIKTPKLTRTAIIDEVRADEETGTRSVKMSFSSEEPYERFFGVEVLDHAEKSVDLSFVNSGNAPLLLDHDPTKQVGVIEKAEIGGDRRGHAMARFGKSALADEVFLDVEDGIRRNISVGYRINEMEAEKGEEGETKTFRVMDWTPLELSVVSIPADTSVGIGRDAGGEFETTVIENQPNVEDKKMTDTPVEKVEAKQVVPEVDTDAIASEAVGHRNNEIAEINAIAEKHNKRSLADKAIKDGLTVAEFKGALLEEIGDDKPIERPAAELGLDSKEQERYSMLRAIKAAGSKDWRGAEFERECSEAIAKRAGKEPRGFFCPMDLSGWGQRDLTVGTDSAGGYMKGTDHLGSSFIDALRDQLVLKGMGARVLSGLQGDVAIPGLNAKTTVYWVAENAAPTEGAPTFRQVTMSPKTVAGYVDMSRKLLAQSDPSVEEVIRADLVSQVAAAIDDVGIEGGASNAPTGITQTSGIGSVALGTNGAVPTWASVVQLVQEVEVDNAATGNLAYLTNPKAKSKMARTAKVSSTDSKMILESPWNELYGYPMTTTNLVPSDLTKGSGSSLSALIFGNFNDLIIGEWGTLDVLVDPYSGSTTGATRMTIFMDVDVAVRHAQSFAAVQDMITT